MISLQVFLVLAIITLANAEFLRIQNKAFYYGTQKVFLSGVNGAWVNYGQDFGNHQYERTSGATLRSWVDQISASGGNTLRIWLHVEGNTNPAFDSNGYVTGTDRDGTLVSELSSFLDYAAGKGVFIIPVLWNGAVMNNNNYKNLLWDTSKLQSYIDKALRPMVRALANKPALAAWEILNEPEGSVKAEANSNKCYDTTMIGQNGAGWSKAYIPMFNLLRFINLQAAAIRQEDQKALVTVGSWSERGQSDAFSDTVNYYKDSCLVGAGGQAKGTIDFYQMHTYSWEGKWSTNAPFKINAARYNLDKPLIIGEFAGVCSQNEGIENLFNYAYNNGYSGALSWQFVSPGGDCSDDQATQKRGMQYIRSKTNNGGVSPIKIK